MIKIFRNESDLPNDFIGKCVILENNISYIYKFYWGMGRVYTYGSLNEYDDGRVKNNTDL